MAHEIILKSMSALNKVDSYKLDANLTEAYSVIGEKDSNTVLTHWKIRKLVSIVQKELQMATNVEQNGVNISSFEVYIIDEWMHLNSILPHINDSSGIPGANWKKVKLSDETWTPESQIIPQIELLETSIKANLTGSENVNNVNCYVLNVTPTARSVADWVISQQQPDGPSLRWWHTSAERSREIYTKAYKNSFIKLWISKDSYLVMKADISALFEVTPSILEPADVPLINTEVTDYGFGKIIADFHWQMNYSNYNQPISIKLPQDALDNQ